MFNWLQNFADWLIYSVFGLSLETELGRALNFFVYDTLKILILLFAIVFLMGIVNAYFPIERLKNYLHRKKLYGLEYFVASIFGAITPFCSCSSVPLFIGFVQGGIPLGVTFAFLITSPLVNEVAIAMFIGMFGFKATLIYASSGILLGTLGGWLLGKFNLEPLLSDWVKNILESLLDKTLLYILVQVLSGKNGLKNMEKKISILYGLVIGLIAPINYKNLLYCLVNFT